MKRNDWQSVFITFVWSKAYATIKVAMEFGGTKYDKMRRKSYYAKLIVVRSEDIAQAMSRLEKYSKRVYGGQLHKRTRINTVNNVISVNAWDNLLSSQEYLTN